MLVRLRLVRLFSLTSPEPARESSVVTLMRTCTLQESKSRLIKVVCKELRHMCWTQIQSWKPSVMQRRRAILTRRALVNLFKLKSRLSLVTSAMLRFSRSCLKSHVLLPSLTMKGRSTSSIKVCHRLRSVPSIRWHHRTQQALTSLRTRLEHTRSTASMIRQTAS